MQLETQLSERNVTFDLHEDAIAWLSERGYDEKMGARPLARVIQEHIKKPLANEILFGKLKKGGVVKVTVAPQEDGKPGLVLEAIPEEQPVKPKPEAEVSEHDADDGDSAPAARAKPVRPAAPEEAANDADVAEVTDEGEDEKPETATRRKASTVPKVPKKK